MHAHGTLSTQAASFVAQSAAQAVAAYGSYKEQGGLAIEYSRHIVLYCLTAVTHTSNTFDVCKVILQPVCCAC
jgi:hypothetical protein